MADRLGHVPSAEVVHGRARRSRGFERFPFPPPRSRSRRSRVKCLPLQEHRPEIPVPVPFRVTGLAWPDSKPPNPVSSFIHPSVLTFRSNQTRSICPRRTPVGSTDWFERSCVLRDEFRACELHFSTEGNDRVTFIFRGVDCRLKEKGAMIVDRCGLEFCAS